MAAQRALAVVEVPTAHRIQPNLRLDLIHELGVAALRRQVVAGGERVARVETDAHARPVIHTVDDCAELSQRAPQRRPLPGHEFEQRLGVGAIRRLGMDAVERGGNAVDTRLLTAAGVRAGMQHHMRNAIGVGALQLVLVRVDAALPQVVLGRGQVDEIGRVADRIENALRLHFILPTGDVVLVDGRPLPLAVVLGEDLHGVGADGRRPVQRLAHTAGNGHVCA